MVPAKCASLNAGFRHLSFDFGPFSSKGVVQRFYDDLNAAIDQEELGEDIFFLNLGYIHDASPSFSKERIGPRVFDRESHQLVLEVIGDCNLDGKRVLEIGCGRGGGAYVLRRHFKPASYLGIDISEKAIAFCRSAHAQPGYEFVQGDAENLAAPQASFDVVLNLESSHSYPDRCSFFLQANRVLAPGGYMLYADSMRADQLSTTVAQLSQAGFEQRRQLNITANVMRACEVVSQRRRQLLNIEEKAAQFANFLASPGSEVFSAYQRRELQYWLFKLRKGA